MNYEDYITKDNFLFKLLEDIGHQIEGYEYTKIINEDKYEKGKWDNVLKNRKEQLNKDIVQLINYILVKYKS